MGVGSWAQHVLKTFEENEFLLSKNDNLLIFNYHGNDLLKWDNNYNCTGLNEKALTKQKMIDFVKFCGEVRKRFKRVVFVIGSLFRIGAKIPMEHEVILEAFAAVASMHGIIVLHPANFFGCLGAKTGRTATASGLPGTIDSMVVSSYAWIDTLDILRRATMLSEGTICLPKSRNMAFHRVWDSPSLVSLMTGSKDYNWQDLNLCHDIKTYMERRHDDSNSSYPDNWKKAWVSKTRPPMSEIIIKQSAPTTPPDDGSKG